MVAIARREAPYALTALDVGAFESPLLSRFDWIPTLVATDMQSRPMVWDHIQGIAFVRGDFMSLSFGTMFDLVICNQVVEHLPDSVVSRFVTKLASLARVLIVSTTFMMPHGTVAGHIQDPISKAKFASWFRNASRWGQLTNITTGHAFRAKSSRFGGGHLVGVWRRRGVVVGSGSSGGSGGGGGGGDIAGGRGTRRVATAATTRPPLLAQPAAGSDGAAAAHRFSACTASKQTEGAGALAYPAPRYFPFPPFVVVLETSKGRCDLAGGPPNCAAFSAGTLMMPEPFVVQTIASFLAHCLHVGSAGNGCYAVDVGGNLGIHTAYMAALGAQVDVIEPSADLASSIAATTRANCWESRIRVHAKAISGDVRSAGKALFFEGGWRLDDRGAKRRRKHMTTLIPLQTFLRGGRRVDLLKIDIDSSRVEASLMTAVERLVAAGEADVRAIVFEVQAGGSTAGGGTGRATTTPARTALATALSRLQLAHGYHAYRLAHHLHSIDDPEGFYSPCIGVRALKFALYVKRLTPAQWVSLLELRKDGSRGRADGASFVLSREALGRDAEARWGSESMDATLPARWKAAKCGMGED